MTINHSIAFKDCEYRRFKRSELPVLAFLSLSCGQIIPLKRGNAAAHGNIDEYQEY
ncbi:MAG: hypothetical protein ACU84H_12635 [Gammaproteobacteria bacterium]